MLSRGATLQEFVAWVEKNMHRTWHREDEQGEFVHGLERSHEIKYIEISIDTRDMKVWRVTTEGIDKHCVRDSIDTGDVTVLDALDKQLDEAAVARVATPGDE